MNSLHNQGTTSTAKRAVLYARVSSDDRGKDGRNLAGQLEMCRKYAMEQGWEIVAEVSEDDRGASGASFELPGLNRVLDMAQAGQFEVLVPREIDRLSRNLAKQLIVEEELHRYGVGVDYVLGDYPDTPEGRLNKHIRATIAEYEREVIVRRMNRGKRRKVESGNVLVGGRPPYGYRVVEEGNKTNLVIHEPEARIIRLIFGWYTEGDGESGPLTMQAVAGKLKGIPTYADIHGLNKRLAWGRWSKSSVAQILKNETYTGRWHFGKRKQANGKWIRNPDDYLLTVVVPAIVSREVWEATQARLVVNKENSRRNMKHDYLLSRRVTCGRCGYKMAGTTSHGSGRVYCYYRCPANANKRSLTRKCDLPGFRVDQVDEAAWQWVKSFLTNPQALEQGLWEVQRGREKENTLIQDRLAVVDDLLADNRSQLERLLELYLSGEFPKDVLTDRKARLEETDSTLEKERVGLVASLDTRVLSIEQIHTTQELSAKVCRNLQAADYDFDAKRQIIEELDVQATLVVENDERVVYARCILGDQVFGVRPIPQGQPFGKSDPYSVSPATVAASSFFTSATASLRAWS